MLFVIRVINSAISSFLLVLLVSTDRHPFTAIEGQMPSDHHFISVEVEGTQHCDICHKKVNLCRAVGYTLHVSQWRRQIDITCATVHLSVCHYVRVE